MFWLLPLLVLLFWALFSRPAEGHPITIRCTEPGEARAEESLGKDESLCTKVKALFLLFITWDEAGVMLRWNLAKGLTKFKLCSQPELILSKEPEGERMNRIMKNWVIILVVKDVFLNSFIEVLLTYHKLQDLKCTIWYNHHNNWYNEFIYCPKCFFLSSISKNLRNRHSLLCYMFLFRDKPANWKVKELLIMYVTLTT